MTEQGRERLRSLIQDIPRCRQICQQLAEHVGRSTIPILLEENGRLRLHGTGNLFRIAHSCFVVSAAHVFRTARQRNIPLYTLASTETEHTFLPLRGVVHCSGEELAGPFLDADVGFDVGLLELSQEDVQNLRGCEFIGLRHLANRQAFEDDLYCLLGFPTELASQFVFDGNSIGKIQPVWLATTPYKGPTASFSNFHADRHILFDSRRDGAVHLFGDQAVPSSLAGISGCSIWKTNSISIARDTWLPSMVRVIGIETGEYRQRGVLKGTAWDGIASLLFKMYPELQASQALMLPDRMGLI